MPRQSRDDITDTYDELVSSKRKLKKDIDASNTQKREAEAKIAADAEAVARAERRQASNAATKQKRDQKSEEAFAKLWESQTKMQETSMKAYDTLAMALMDIAMHSLLISKALNAEMWAIAAGPMSDMLYEGTASVIGGIVGLPVSAVRGTLSFAANKTRGLLDFSDIKTAALDLPPELLEISPYEMIQVNDVTGELSFEKFSERFQGTQVDAEVLTRLDEFYERATRIHLKNHGYERRADGVFEHTDGTALTSDKLDALLGAQITNVEELMQSAMNNEPPPAPTMGM